jgi:hypothetical protein
MFRSDQKLYGYVWDGEDWIEFDSWTLMAKKEVDYRTWKSEFEKKIHVSKNVESRLLYFNRGHRTFSYFSNLENGNAGTSGPVSLSHLLRQKVISELKSAKFILKNAIAKNNTEQKEYDFKFKKIYVEQSISIEGAKYIPDLIIEFDEPVELALKWSNKIYVEVVEYNETSGQKIKEYGKLDHGVIEIPNSERFSKLDGKKISDISKKELDELLNFIRNSFKKVIYGKLIVDPSSEKYLTYLIDSEKAIENAKLKVSIEELNEMNNNLKSKVSQLNLTIQQHEGIIDKLNIELKNQKKINFDYLIKEKILVQTIQKWEEKSLLKKIIYGFNH